MKPFQVFRPFKPFLAGGAGVGTGILRPRSATVAPNTTNMCRVTFSQCMIMDPFHAGVEYQLNGGVWQACGASFQDSDTVCRFSMNSPPPVEGDVIRWRYVPGVPSAGGIGITDCEVPAVEMEAAEIAVRNPIDTTAPFIVSADVGSEGPDVVRVVISEPVQTDDRTDGWAISSSVTGPHTILSVDSSHSGEIHLTLATPIQVDEGVLLEYEGPPVGDVTDKSEWPSPNDLEEELMFPVDNEIPTDDYILLETGGADILLLEDASGSGDGINLETAP